MAGGGSSDCHIIPTTDSNIFRLRVNLLSPEDGPAQCLSTSTVVAGYRCRTFYWPAPTSTYVALALCVSHSPVLQESAGKVSAHMVLLDKSGSPAPSIRSGKSADISDCGFVLTVRIDDVKAKCAVDNYFEALCSMNVDCRSVSRLIPPCTPPDSSTGNELPDLGQDLLTMRGKQELTDSFDVGGESFSAHRLVLAARSPVFRAELYGPMAESQMTSITIKDMDASTFRSMLHYLYHGSLPNNAGCTEDVSFTVAEYQHLLIAADRYGIERLKKNCEEKLIADCVTTDSVVSMLELAEDHVCSKLKARCLDFLADADNFKMVAISGEYIPLMQSFPNLLVEVRNRIKIAHEESTSMKVRHMNSNPFTIACLLWSILYLVVAGIFIFLI